MGAVVDCPGEIRYIPRPFCGVREGLALARLGPVGPESLG